MLISFLRVLLGTDTKLTHTSIFVASFGLVCSKVNTNTCIHDPVVAKIKNT
jgi:hypothetical protein